MRLEAAWKTRRQGGFRQNAAARMPRLCLKIVSRTTALGCCFSQLRTDFFLLTADRCGPKLNFVRLWADSTVPAAPSLSSSELIRYRNITYEHASSHAKRGSSRRHALYRSPKSLNWLQILRLNKESPAQRARISGIAADDRQNTLPISFHRSTKIDWLRVMLRNTEIPHVHVYKSSFIYMFVNTISTAPIATFFISLCYRRNDWPVIPTWAIDRILPLIMRVSCCLCIGAPGSKLANFALSSGRCFASLTT